MMYLKDLLNNKKGEVAMVLESNDLRINQNIPDYPYDVEIVLSEDRLESFKKMWFNRGNFEDEKDFFDKNGLEPIKPLHKEHILMARGLGDNREVDELFVFHNMLKNWSNYIEIVSFLTNNKVSDSNIWHMAMYVEDAVKELPVSKNYLFNKSSFLQGMTMVSIVANALPPLLNDLTVKEFRYFLFCMIVRDYIKIDTPKVKGVPGIFAFFSVDYIKDLYDKRAEEFLGKEDTLPLYDETKPFGYSLENPVLSTDVERSIKYMFSLVPKNGGVALKRIDSCKGIFGETLDKYLVFVDGKEKYIYVNPYSIKNSSEVPKDFI